MARRYYTVEVKDFTGWRPRLVATGVGISYARGYVAAMLERYPCPPIRIIDFNTKEVVQENSGNGEPHLN